MFKVNNKKKLNNVNGVISNASIADFEQLHVTWQACANLTDTCNLAGASYGLGTNNLAGT